MCGFVLGNIFKNKKQFSESLKLIDHRGKDDKGIVYNKKTKLQ